MSSALESAGLGEWIKQKRLERKLSLRELADLAGIAHSSLDKLERGGGARDSTVELLVGALAGPDASPEEVQELLMEARRVRAGLPELDREPDEEYLQDSIMAYSGPNPILSAAAATARSMKQLFDNAGPELTGDEPKDVLVRGRRKGITKVDGK